MGRGGWFEPASLPLAQDFRPADGAMSPRQISGGRQDKKAATIKRLTKISSVLVALVVLCTLFLAGRPGRPRGHALDSKVRRGVFQTELVCGVNPCMHLTLHHKDPAASRGRRNAADEANGRDSGPGPRHGLASGRASSWRLMPCPCRRPGLTSFSSTLVTQPNLQIGGDIPPRTRRVCTNTCPTARDGVCQDGRPSRNQTAAGFYSTLQPVGCDLGTDCDDCGPWEGPASGAAASWKPIALLREAGIPIFVRRVTSPAGYLMAVTDPKNDTDVSKKVAEKGYFEPVLTTIWCASGGWDRGHARIGRALVWCRRDSRARPRVRGGAVSGQTDAPRPGHAGRSAVGWRGNGEHVAVQSHGRPESAPAGRRAACSASYPGRFPACPHAGMTS